MYCTLYMDRTHGCHKHLGEARTAHSMGVCTLQVTTCTKDMMMRNDELSAYMINYRTLLQVQVNDPDVLMALYSLPLPFCLLHVYIMVQ